MADQVYRRRVEFPLHGHTLSVERGPCPVSAHSSSQQPKPGAKDCFYHTEGKEKVLWNVGEHVAAGRRETPVLHPPNLPYAEMGGGWRQRP